MRKFRIDLPPPSSHRSAVFAFGGMAVLAAFALLSCDGASGTNASGPSAAERFRPDHIVVVILENRSFQDLVGARDMPYLNTVVAGSALMTNAYAHEIPYRYVPPGFQHPLPARPSQTNYLPLFAGHNQMTLPTWFQSPGSPYLGAVVGAGLLYLTLAYKYPAEAGKAFRDVTNELLGRVQEKNRHRTLSQEFIGNISVHA